MRPHVLFTAFVLVIVVSALPGAAVADAPEATWVALYHSEVLPAGTFHVSDSPLGPDYWRFPVTWESPEPGSGSGWDYEFFVWDHVPLYDGVAVLRPNHYMLVRNPAGEGCIKLKGVVDPNQPWLSWPALNPAQPTRLVAGWTPDEGLLSRGEAEKYYHGVVVSGVINQTIPVDLHAEQPQVYVDQTTLDAEICERFTRFGS